MSGIPDFALETTWDFKFTTRQFSDGVPTTLGGVPVIDIYEDNDIAQITGAETLTVDFDGVTGLNNLRIAMTAANGFESGKSYSAVITTGTVGGTSVVGEVVCNFTIEKQSALRPTTAGRTLDVAATGEAGIDLDNTNGALGTTDFDAAFFTAALFAAGALDANALNTDAVNEIVDQVWDELKAGHVGAGSFGEEVQLHALSSEIAALNDPSAADNADAVWDELKAGHVGAGSFGEEVQAHATQAEILSDATPFPGANIDATISSRSDFDETADPVELLDSGGAAGTSAAELVDDVWDEPKAGHVAAGSFGEEVQAHALSSEIAALNDLSAAEVNTEMDSALADARLDELASATAGGIDPVAGSLLDQVMNKDGAQTFDQGTDSLEAIADSGGGGPTAADIADAVWDEGKAGHVGAGSFGEEVQNHALSSEIASLNDLSQADILSDATPFAGANIDAAISSRAVAGDAMDLVANALDAAALALDAGQEIADRVLARSLASGADGGRTVQDALRILRNLRQVVAGTLTVMQEDDVTPAWTAAVSTAASDPIDSIDPT
jgi:hypothetical protein